jgi:CheY-like chemotaxis protein
VPARAEPPAATTHEVRARIRSMRDAAEQALDWVSEPRLRSTLETIRDQGDAAVALLDGAAADADAPPVGDAPATRPGARPLSILLVEDDPVSQLVCVGLLEQLGHRVAVVGDGRQAVDTIASGRRFDVVLMDLVMPVMGGTAATRAIRALPAGQRDVPIVAATASPVRADLDEALAAGMVGVIAKPFDQARLDAVLARITAAPSPAETGEIGPPPDCDAAVIRQLYGALGRDAVMAAMRGFLDGLAANAAALEPILASDPAQAWTRAHRYAGSAAVFGFRRLSRALLAIEDALRAGATERARGLLHGVPELVSAVVQHLTAAA